MNMKEGWEVVEEIMRVGLQPQPSNVRERRVAMVNASAGGCNKCGKDVLELEGLLVSGNLLDPATEQGIGYLWCKACWQKEQKAIGGKLTVGHHVVDLRKP